MKRDAYAKVADLLPESEFRANVRALQDAWGGLLDDEAAGLLLSAQLGRDVVEYQRIADLQEGSEATLSVEVVEVLPTREFARQDGRRGRVANVAVRDASGRCLLVLWDEDTELLGREGVRPGTRLRCFDGFVRRTNFGLEVTRGRFGRVLVG